jgi:tetratricopeptide (TPR) repeat protein
MRRNPLLITILITILIALGLLLTGCKSTATSTGNPHLESGRTAIVDKKFDLALKELTTAITEEPDNAEAYYLRGTAYYGRYDAAYTAKDPKADGEDFWRAITDFTKAIELNHNYAEAYHYRGLTFNGLQENGHALADYNIAIQLQPKMEFPYYGRAIVYEQEGHIQQAIADYQMFLELSKDVYWRGEAQKRMNALLALPPTPAATPSATPTPTSAP